MLKLDGQLNALILPSEDSEEFSWDAFDGLPVAVALDGQSPSSDSVNVRWGRSGLELLEKGEDTSLCRHLETGRVLPILNRYLRPWTQRPVVRGLHRLRASCIPWRPADRCSFHLTGIFVQKRRTYWLVLWPVIGYTVKRNK